MQHMNESSSITSLNQPLQVPELGRFWKQNFIKKYIDRATSLI